jgi:hypothetical protein
VAPLWLAPRSRKHDWPNPMSGGPFPDGTLHAATPRLCLACCSHIAAHSLSACHIYAHSSASVPPSAMASSGVDLAALTPDQQATLQQFTAVTNQEVEAAVPLLQRCEWNVQVRHSILPAGYPHVLTKSPDRHRPLLRWRAGH